MKDKTLCLGDRGSRVQISPLRPFVSRARISIMHRFLLAGAILLSFTASVAAQEPPKVTTLMSRDLTDIPGKEGTMLTWSMRLAERTPFIATTRMHSCTCWKAPSSCRSRGRSQSPFTLVRPSMKVRTMFTLSVATPARRSRRSFSSSSLRTRVRPS